MSDRHRRVLVVAGCLLAFSLAMAGTGLVPGEAVQFDPVDAAKDAGLVGSGNGNGEGGGTGSGGGSGTPTPDVRTPDPDPPDSDEDDDTDPRSEPDLATESTGRTQSSALVGGDLSRSSSSRISGDLDGVSPRVLFTVEAPSAGYWRTSAFAHYTGDGWTRSEVLRTAAPPIVNRSGRLIEQRITPRVPMQVVPAQYAPVRLGDDLAVGARTTVGDGIVLESPVEPNETVTVFSRVSRPSADRLRSAGRTYPDAIRERYASLPESVPEALRDRTAEVTADAENPYEAAVAIERHLERTKEYSLNVSRPEGDVATSFLLEMDAGYCQYFATTMVVMLRSEGIPARYVTGFAGGQSAGEDTYVVRGMNAHAWVEVYFPDVGWVRFDPTPATPRLSAERDALSAARDRGLSNVDAEDSGDARYRVAGDDLPAVVPGGDATGSDEGPPLNVTLRPDPVPGREVTVVVRSDGDPVAEALVLFNGNRVGRTGPEGTLTAEVPFADRLSVQVRPPPGGIDDGAGGESARLGAAGGPAGTHGGGSAAVAAHGVVRRTGTAIPSPRPPNGSGANETYSLPTTPDFSPVEPPIPGTSVAYNVTLDGVPLRDVAVRADGATVGRTNESGQVVVTVPYRPFHLAVDRGAVRTNETLSPVDEVRVRATPRPVPGRNVTLTATIRNYSVPRATVSVDGTTVGTTGRNGTVRLRVPYAERLNVTVSRGAITASRSAPVAARMNATVTGVKLAGLPVGVNASVAGRPVANATVLANGRVVGRTGPDGTLSTSLPLTSAAELTIRKGGLTVSRRFDGLVTPYLVAGGGLLALVVSVVALRRTDEEASLRDLPGLLVEGVLSGGLALATGLATLGAGAAVRWAGIRRRLGAVRDAATPRERGAALVDALRAGLAALLAPVGRALAGLATAIPTGKGGDDGPRDDPTADVGTVPSGGEGGDARSFDVAAAWDWVERNTDVRERRTLTPAEVARRAAERGRPPEAVETLLSAYREVVYAERTLSADRREAARQALDAIAESVDRERDSGGKNDRGGDPE